MKFKRSHVIISVIATLAAAYYSWWFFASGDVFHSSKRNAPNRTALLQLYEAVAVGSSHAEVLAAYWQHRTEELKLSAERPSAWSVRMPLEFGASDWLLLVEFRDDRVSAVRVRMSDGPPPKDGPKDKQKDAR